MKFKRSNFLKTAIGATAGAATAATASPWYSEAEAAIGNYPGGTTGPSIFVGLCTPFTGSYSADGEDQHKGFVLAMEDLNNGTGVMAKIPSLAGKKGLLGKKIVYKVADSETKPDVAVQRATEFITQNKAILIVGGLSSASDIALEKLAQQQKVLYMVGPSASNDTTGKDCQRYGFRSQPDGYMVAAALDPYLIKEYGRNRKCIFLLPDYTYGHSMTDSLANDLKARGGWTVVDKVVAPFPTSDYSSYLTNIANSDAEIFLNIEYGNDGVASTKQAVGFGITKKMKLVIPKMSSYLPDGLGPEIMQGNLGVQDWYWAFADHYPNSKIFLDTFRKRFPGYYPRWTAHVGYTQVAMWADAVAHVKTFDPVAIIKYLEEGNKVNMMLGDIYYRAGDHNEVRPVPVLRGKARSAMRNKEDYFDIVALVAGEKVMQPLAETGCTMPPYT